jgi:hypothetical protein
LAAAPGWFRNGITTGTVKTPPKKAASGDESEKKSKLLEALKDFNKRRSE